MGASTKQIGYVESGIVNGGNKHSQMSESKYDLTEMVHCVRPRGVKGARYCSVHGRKGASYLKSYNPEDLEVVMRSRVKRKIAPRKSKKGRGMWGEDLVDVDHLMQLLRVEDWDRTGCGDYCGSGGRTKGWKEISPTTMDEREDLFKACGSKCFLHPKRDSRGMRKFPICGKGEGCRPDCRALRAAKSNATANGYDAIALMADALVSKNCM